MYFIKGFVSNDNYVDNNGNTVAQFGVLSTQALTYSRNVDRYIDPSHEGMRLTTFQSIDNAGANAVAPTPVANYLISVGNYLFGRHDNSTITTSVSALVADLTDEFDTPSFNITGMEIDALITNNANSTKRLPEYVRWQFTQVSTGNNYDVTLWFGDQYFRNQYDLYEVIAIAPLLVVDDFYNTNANVGASLSQVTTKSIIQKIDQIAGNFPYTTVVTRTIQWKEHNNFGSGSRDVDWHFVVYGAAGTGPDGTNAAIRDYLADPDNSSLELEKWQAMFPSVYESSEYYIIPYWNRVVSNVPTILYSPVVKPVSTRLIAELNVPFTASSTWWDQYLSNTTSAFQTLSFGIIGSPANVTNNDFDFTIKYSDYLNIGLNHPDAGRMSPSTQGLVSVLNVLFDKAEELTASTPTSSLPIGYSRIIRDGKVYISVVYESTRYYAITKGSYVTQ